MSEWTSPNRGDEDHTNGASGGHGTPPISLRIPGGAGAPGCARRLAAPFLLHVDHMIASDVQLIVSELVTNSVRHAGVGPDEMVTVDLAVLDAYLRIPGTDPGGELEHRLLA